MSGPGAGNTPASHQATPVPLHGGALLAGGVMIAFANFMATLDLTIANVSIPTIAAALGASPREGTWVVTSYAVAEAITVPLTGWLSARFGPVRTFVATLAIFGIASALCGAATTLQMLLLMRVVQGLAGGPMVPLSQILLMSIFPKERANRAMGLWAMTTVLGPVAGPLLGGQICDNWSWPWVFMINAPLALGSALFCMRVLKGRDPPPQYTRIDVVGLGLLVLWIGTVQVMLDLGPDLDWFGSTKIIALCVMAVIGFLAFVIWELTDPNPIVNLRVFRHRGFSVAVIVVCFGFGSFFGQSIISGLWMQTNLGYTPGWTGIASSPAGLAVFAMSPLVAWLTARFDLRIIISSGLLLFASVFAWRATFASTVTLELIMFSQLLIGVCMAYFFAPANSYALGAVQPHEVASAAGLLSFTRTTSMAFAMSLATTEWQDATIRNRVEIVERFQGADALHRVDIPGYLPGQAVHALSYIVDNQAVMLATNNLYDVMAGGMILGALSMWIAPRIRAAARVSAAH